VGLKSFRFADPIRLHPALSSDYLWELGIGNWELIPSIMSEIAEYCRQIESYLCQKNAGHLIRIVGPAFEQVCGWAERGVPLAVAFKGIDQYCERYYAKGLRRRPVRIEFCETDILELFDDWRRAVGVMASGAAAEAPRRPSLAAHIERAIARLAVPRRTPNAAVLDPMIEQAMQEMDGLLAEARHARGEKRSAIVMRLAEIDRRLLEAAVAALDETSRASLRREAESELTPFAGRMAPDAHRTAVDAAFMRLARETQALPTISFE
jgi:hypothetical protein